MSKADQEGRHMGNRSGAMTPQEKEILDQELEDYFKQRKERIARSGRSVGNTKGKPVRFVDTAETLSMYPDHKDM